MKIEVGPSVPRGDPEIGGPRCSQAWRCRDLADQGKTWEPLSASSVALRMKRLKRRRTTVKHLGEVTQLAVQVIHVLRQALDVRRDLRNGEPIRRKRLNS
mmetsp:Transcript_50591/g.120679  ORF Transcript_50591/g.120679 Transcript_50591/m.120679 type:complete len:100 (-) Transcript_50591:340-639(-)